MSRSQSCVVGPKHLIISWWVLSRPGALPSLRRYMAYPRSWIVKGVKMVSRLSVFSTAFLLRVLQFWSGFQLSRSWWAIASCVMFGELLGFLSSPLFFERVCHPFLLLCVKAIPVIISSHFSFLVSLMWSFRLVPASTVSSLKDQHHTVLGNVSGAHRKYASIDSDTRTTRDSREHLLQRNSTSASEYWRTAKHPACMTSKLSWSSSLDPRHATGYFVFSTTVLRLRKFRRYGDRLR